MNWKFGFHMIHWSFPFIISFLAFLWFLICWLETSISARGRVTYIGSRSRQSATCRDIIFLTMYQKWNDKIWKLDVSYENIIFNSECHKARVLTSRQFDDLISANATRLRSILTKFSEEGWAAIWLGFIIFAETFVSISLLLHIK